MDLFILRNILKNDNQVSDYITSKYWPNFEVKYSNIGFIIIKSDFVYKYFISNDYLKDNVWYEWNFDFINRELDNYKLFSNNKIIVPIIYSTWNIEIWNYTFWYIKMENIRKNYKKIKNFSEINISLFSDFIKTIHSIKNWYIHWAIHTSDFYLLPDNKIWIFDLVNYYKWDIEKDISRICIWYNFDYISIENFLISYWVEKINFNKLTNYIYDTLKNEDFSYYNKGDILKTFYIFKKLS